MGLTSLQASMDASDWLQGAMCNDGGIGSSSPSSTDMLACARPIMERRLRPPHDQVLKCPRCESTNTKFCYYNNYSLTQPRYFCKTCRRYWTKGGTLRNIPVGGGCRKNKRHSSLLGSKKHISEQQNSATSDPQSHHPSPTELQLHFPEVQLSHHQLASLMGGGGGIGASFLDNKYNALLDRHSNYEGYLGSKFDALMGNTGSNTTRAHDLLGSTTFGVDFGAHGMSSATNNYMNPISSSPSPFDSESNIDSSYQRLMLPYDYNNHHMMNSNVHDHHQTGFVDMKPNPKLLSLQWQDNTGGANAENNHNGGYSGFSAWGAGSMLNGYTPSSTTNTLI